MQNENTNFIMFKKLTELIEELVANLSPIDSQV